MTLAYVMQLDFTIHKTDIGIQKIDGLTIKWS